MRKNIISDYKDLIWNIWILLQSAKSNVVQVVNTILVQTYWNIWKQIVEYEQNWEKRAKYWDKLLKNLSIDLTKKYWKGFSERNIERMRQFYIYFPKLNFKKSSTLLAKLSWSHICRLLGIRDTKERQFYLIELWENSWSVRELDRQINSSLYERLSLSKDKKWVIALSKKWQVIEKNNDLLKDPYVLEFLGLEEKSIYSENDIESAIITNLQYFLLELWKGFTFVSRQQRITNWPDHYFIDLVFYNRLLKCFVLIDLKIWKLKHQDIGQMQMYVNYYDKNYKNDTENPTIGIVLCKEKDDFVVEYTLWKNTNQIYAKEYKLYIPNKSQLQKELKKFMK